MLEGRRIVKLSAGKSCVCNWCYSHEAHEEGLCTKMMAGTVPGPTIGTTTIHNSGNRANGQTG